jgi:hypothetical protein
LVVRAWAEAVIWLLGPVVVLASLALASGRRFWWLLATLAMQSYLPPVVAARFITTDLLPRVDPAVAGLPIIRSATARAWLLVPVAPMLRIPGALVALRMLMRRTELRFGKTER